MNSEAGMELECESRTKSRVQLGPKPDDPHLHCRLGALTDMICLTQTIFFSFFPFCYPYSQPTQAETSPVPMRLMENHLSSGCRGPSSSKDTAVHLWISPLPVIRGQSWGYLLGLHSYYNELASETSSRQKSNILTLYPSKF